MLDGSGSPQSFATYKNRYTYTGREWDEVLDLYHYRARMYSPVAGRFVGRDPIGFGSGDVSLVAYVRNRPVDLIDPYGLCCEPCNITSIKGVVNASHKPPLSDPFGETDGGIDLDQPGIQLPTNGDLTGVSKVFWIVLEGENLDDCDVSRYVTGTFKVNGQPTQTPIRPPLDGKYPVKPEPPYIDVAGDGTAVPGGIGPNEQGKGPGTIVIADGPGVRPVPNLTSIDFKYHFLIDVKSSCAGKRVASLGFDLTLKGTIVDGTFQNPGTHDVEKPWLSWPPGVTGGATK